MSPTVREIVEISHLAIHEMEIAAPNGTIGEVSPMVTNNYVTKNRFD